MEKKKFGHWKLAAVCSCSKHPFNVLTIGLRYNFDIIAEIQ